MKNGILETKKILVIVSLCVLFIFVSGQQGCQSSASKQGLDFTLISRAGFLTAGKTLHQEESFYVGARIENYDFRERSGLICIRDDVDEGFGGISSQGMGECQNFVVRAAEKKKSEKKGLFPSSSEITPGVVEVYYPQEQEYRYFGLPSTVKPYSPNLFVSLQYNEITQATATVTVPGTEHPVAAQEPSLIKASFLKTLYPRSDGYKLDLTVDLTKQSTGKIFLPDFSKENYTQFHIQLYNVPLECSVAGKPVFGEVSIENTRTIKCSGFVYSKNEQSFPLVLTLSYGVILEKKFNFNIKTIEE
ncbi:MAG: hypothetical protein QXP53_01265 [Candidatus Pacearchaeota archaeon]